MPPDDDPLPAFAPQWLRSGQTNKAALGAGAGSVAQAKGEPRGPARPALSPQGERDLTGSARKPSDRAGSWGPGTGTAGPSRPSTSTAARPSYRAGSADTARDRITYREEEEERYSFSSRLVGQTTPKRTNSLDSPGKAPGREWEDKGPRSAERRVDNGGVRRGLDVTRPGPAPARAPERSYGSTAAARVGPARDSWQPLSPELPRSRPETDQPWTSRLADVSPARVAAANPLLPVLGAVATAVPAVQSAPQTPRMADALQQAGKDTAASAVAEQLRREQLALKQSKQLIPILAPASKGKPYKSPAAAHSASALANGTKTSALLNGALPRKSSLESLGRMGGQGTRGEESNVLGNGHGSGPSLVELGMALERPASSASTGSGTQKAAACPAAPGAQGPAMTQRSPKAGGALKERERNSFFDSLRRKSRSPSLAPLGEGEDAPAGAAPPTEAAADTATLAEPKETPEPASPATPASPAQHVLQQSAATHNAADNQQQHTPAAAGSAAGEISPIRGAADKPATSASTETKKGSSGSLSDRLRIPAEEEAFLRSLGWDGSDLGDDDDEEGGLTEEEIAAFQAKAQAAQFTRGVHRLNYGKQP